MISLKHAFEIGQFSYSAAVESGRRERAQKILNLPISDDVVVVFATWVHPDRIEVTVGITTSGTYNSLDSFQNQSQADAFVEECQAFLKEMKP